MFIYLNTFKYLSSINSLQIDVETIEPPLYYSSGDEPDEDSLFYLPVAPDIDDPEGEVVPGYDVVQNTSSGNKNDDDSPDNGEPSSKKTKITDVDINGEVYNQNNLMAGWLFFK